jgi:endonuclease/exonuclease/phosphatase family metal-dependent hydrolase
MVEVLRVLSWNCRRATETSKVWDYFLDTQPDIALLQEVTRVPARVREQFACIMERAMGKNDTQQKFSTAILVRGKIGPVIPMAGPLPWVDDELKLFAGNILARVVKPDKGPELNVVSVYSPAWPVSRIRLQGMDISNVKLTQNPDVWIADLLWASLKFKPPLKGDLWIIGGDFNLSETFDLWKGGPRGNREYLDRMTSLGLVECLRSYQDVLTPTYKNLTGGAIKHQMDHVFTTAGLKGRLLSCITGTHEQVFDQGLSDHLPIIADFKIT